MDIGAVWVGGPFEHNVWFTNRSHDVIRLDRVMTSRGCTRVENSLLEIAPGASARVGLTIDPRGMLGLDQLEDEFTLSIHCGTVSYTSGELLVRRD